LETWILGKFIGFTRRFAKKGIQN